MKLIENLAQVDAPFHKAVITIGNFDGVHIGHQALFHQVIERADAIGGTSVAMTFEPHPIRVLQQNGNPPLITLYRQKVELIRSTGIDVLICVPFTHEFAAVSARDFVADLLVKRLGVRSIIVGKDYTFGRNREGNLDLLVQLTRQMGVELVVADWIEALNGNAGRISSTRVRNLVMAGEMKKASQLLGRYYQIAGEVAPGRNRGGRTLGFPTANINLIDELCPQTGVYAVTVQWGPKTFQGVANIGYSPTFDDRVFTVEVHLLDFDGDLYGQELRVNFVQRIRSEIKFAGVAELADQIRRDVETARRILNR